MPKTCLLNQIAKHNKTTFLNANKIKIFSIHSKLNQIHFIKQFLKVLICTRKTIMLEKIDVAKTRKQSVGYTD